MSRGDPGGYFTEKLKNQIIEVHFSCILKVILTLPLRISGPFAAREGVRTHPSHPSLLSMALYVLFTLRNITILVPIALFASLSRRGLGTRNEGLWGQLGTQDFQS